MLTSFFVSILNKQREEVFGKDYLPVLVWKVSLSLTQNQVFIAWIAIGFFQYMKMALYNSDQSDYKEQLLLLVFVMFFMLFNIEEYYTKYKCNRGHGCKHTDFYDIGYHGKYVVFGPHANIAARLRFALFLVGAVLFRIAFFLLKTYCLAPLVWPYIAYIDVSIFLQLWFRYSCSQYAKHINIYAARVEEEVKEFEEIEKQGKKIDEEKLKRPIVAEMV